MSSLVLPASYAREQLHDRLRDRQPAWAAFDRRLKEIDPNLSLVYWGEREIPQEGTIPGRFHVARDNGPGIRPGYYPVVGRGGEYREPDSSVLEEMRRSDMWSDRSVRVATDRTRREQRAKERAEDLNREQRRYELAKNIKAVDRPGVLFSDARPKRRKAN